MPEFTFESVTVDECGVEIASEQHQARYFSQAVPGGAFLELVAIPAGIFRMGSTRQEGYADERPQHPVVMPAFWMGRYPVTQEQWLALMKKPLPWRCEGAHKPADRVSWNDAREFCQHLAASSGRPYRLPSEAEWEYACRAGTTTPFSFGKTLTTALANYVGEHIYDGEPKGIYRHGSMDVGSFPPNAFGLQDMHGNLWEWCADAWHDDYTGAPVNGAAWLARDEQGRVMRGGSWHETPANCRSAIRLKANPREREDFFGFRVALADDSQLHTG